MTKGTIKRLMERGFGFIKGEGEEEGQEIEFEVGQGRDGRKQAVNVRLAEPKD